MRRRFSWSACRGFLLTLVFTVATCIGWLLFIRIQEDNEEKEEEHKEGGGEKHGEEEVDAASSSEDGGHEGGEGGGGEGHEGGGGGGGEGHEGGEEGIDPIAQITTAVIIILLLIIVTILFEKAKEAIEDMADKVTKPAIQSLFGELTVLGFLSVTTFLLVQAGVFDALSEELFGEAEWLEELFEKIHYVLFFVMCSFLAQVLRILYYSPKSLKEWQTMEMESQDEELMEQILQTPPTKRHYSEKELLLYYNLRKEFIINRSVEPPFAPSFDPLPENFDFCSYLHHNFGQSCCEIVEVGVPTWIFFMVCTLIFYCICLAIHNDMEILQWIWLAIGWLVMFVAVAFSYYLDRIKRAYTPANSVPASQYLEEPSGLNLNLEEETQSSQQMSALKDTPPEHAPTKSKSSIHEALPRWCQIDLERYLGKRGCLTKKISHHHQPTRQDALYWFEREGHEFHLMAYQIGLISIDVYLGVLIVLFASHLHSTGEAIFYMLLAIAPFMVIIGNARRQMKDLAIVGCMGSFRNDVGIAKVIREEKTAHAVRAFLVLEKMHRHAREGFRPSTIGINLSVPAEMEEAELEVLDRTFDAFDPDGSGHITHNELASMLQNFGAVDTIAIQRLIAALDDDNSGTVTKEEFIHWYTANMIDEHGVTIKDRAHNLFVMFDKDGDGKIGLQEFQTALDAFNMGFTIDDIGLIVTELNEEGGTTVGLEQFEDMMEKFYPDEIDSGKKRKKPVMRSKTKSNPRKRKQQEMKALLELAAVEVDIADGVYTGGSSRTESESTLSQSARWDALTLVYC